MRRPARAGIVLALGAALLEPACRDRGARVFDAAAAPRRITSSAGLELEAAFSPDGAEIAYSSARTGRFEIYVRTLADGRERPLTSDGKQNFQPSFSPDGRTIVYHSKDRIGIWLTPSEPGRGEPRPLTNFGSRPRYSPDGRNVVFQSEEHNAISATTTSPPSTIWVVPAVGGPARRITTAGEPRGGHGSPIFTHRGKRICFVSEAPGRTDVALFSIGLDGGKLVPLLTAPRLFEPVLAPDDETFYYGGSDGTSLHAVMTARVSTDTGKRIEGPRQLTPPGIVVPRHLALSRDGRKLAWTGLSASGHIRSISVSKEGDPVGEPSALTTSGHRDSRPVFSPDGRRIAFDRRLEGENEQVWVMDADGRNPVRITAGQASRYSRNWFPDGRRLFVMGVEAGRKEVRALAVDVESKAETSLPLPPEDFGPARLSPDGSRVAFHSQRKGFTWNVWSVGFDGRPPVQLTFDREQVAYPVFSPDGRLLAIEARRGDDSHVAVMPSAGGTPTQLTFERGLSWSSGWSPDGDKIVFAGLRGDAWNVYWVSRTSLAVRRLTDYSLLSSYVRYPAWSPAGNQIAYEYGETSGGLAILEASTKR